MTAPRPKLVVWDFDGVLNRNIRDGRFVWADNLDRDLGMDPAAFSDFVFRSGRIRDVVRGKTDLLDVVATWLEQQNHDIQARDFLTYWFEQDALPDPEVTGWLTAHAGRRVIGTNNETRRASYIEDRMGFAKLVDQVFASGRLGVAKPDLAFFHRIEDWAGLRGSDILLIDDTAANIEACESIGWSGFHFTPNTRADLPQRLGLQ